MASPQRNRGWIWFFLILLGLAILVPALMIVLARGQQLTPEKLAAARERWRRHGPSDYQMKYVIKRTADDQGDLYVVTVRDGRVRSVTVNGRPEPPERFRHYGMERLFAFIDDFFRLDAKSGQRRVFLQGAFAEKDGHLQKYVRRVAGTRERQEILMESFQPLESEARRGEPAALISGRSTALQARPTRGDSETF